MKGVEISTLLLRRLAGQRILTESGRGGVYIFIMAYCYQLANLCMYPLIQNDISRRDLLKREIAELKEEKG